MFYYVLIFILIQFISYMLIVRNLYIFKSEKGIFLYHLIPGLLITAITIYLWFILKNTVLADLILCISLYGIYAISFLELWSLAQGGYSLSIIEEIRIAEFECRKPDINKLVSIGKIKFTNRIQSLLNKKILLEEKGNFELTSKGRLIFTVLNFVHWLVNGKYQHIK